VDRYNRITIEQTALQGNMAASAWHIAFVSDREFFNEAMEQYSYTVPLNSIAIKWGLALAVLSTLAIDLMVFGSTRFFRLLMHRRKEVLSAQSTRG
jgi:hypothetical protein